MPSEKRSFARVVVDDDIVYKLAQKEDGKGDDVIMFYNAWSPPTSYEVKDEYGKIVESVAKTITVQKLVYGHYCTSENIQQLLEIDATIFTDSIVICKYGLSGRANKPANVKPYGALAVLQFSDPYDYSLPDEKGYPDDAGIPWDTVQRNILNIVLCYLIVF